MRRATSVLVRASVVCLLLGTASGGASATQLGPFTVHVSEQQSELESGLTQVTFSFSTNPSQPDANYSLTLTNPARESSSQHGLLDADGTGTAVSELTHSGLYLVEVSVSAGGVISTGTLHFKGRVISSPAYFLYTGRHPGSVLYSVSRSSDKKKRIVPYHGSIGGFGDPSAYADATGTVDPPDRECAALNYHGTLFGARDAPSAPCGMGKALLASDTSFPLFFLGTAVTRELWVKEYLAKGSADIRDLSIAIPRERLVRDQVATATKTRSLGTFATRALERLRAADARNVQAFSALQALSRGRGGTGEKRVARTALTAAIDHMQGVIELLAEHRLLVRSRVREYALSIDGGYVAAATRTDLCARVTATTAERGRNVLVDTVRTDGSTEERVVRLDANGRAVFHVNAPPASGRTTTVTASAFGAVSVSVDFDLYADAPAGC